MITKFNVRKTKQLSKINRFLSLFYKKPVIKDKKKLSDIQRVLIVDFALIGDMVMNIPFLKTIKHNCPSAEITMVCMPWAESILGDQNLVDEFVVFNGKDKLSSPTQILRNYREIKDVLQILNSKEYDVGFEPKGDLRHILFLHYTRCNRTVSYNYTGGEYLITDCFTPRKETKHLLDEKMDLLKMLGFAVHEDDKIPVLILSTEMKTYVDNFEKEYHIQDKIKIGIHPGASNTNKQYKNYPELIREMTRLVTNKHCFVIFEGPGESDIVNSVCDVIEGENVAYVRIKEGIREYKCLVSMCDYMICNDSAAGHLATAYGIPTVVIFGPVEPITALPRGNCKVRYISHMLECKPCTLPYCPNGTEACINSVKLDEVLKEIMILDCECKDKREDIHEANN